MYQIFFEKHNKRVLIGSYETHEEALKEGIKYVKSLGYLPAAIWGGWSNQDGDEYHDFGSWNSYLVVRHVIV